MVLFALPAFSGSWIRINQLGYLPQATKVAVFMSNDAVSLGSFDVIDAYTGRMK